MAELYLYDSAERVRAFYLLLNHLAMRAKAAGDTRSMDVLRTEALMRLVLGGPGMDRVHIELRVTIPSSVLAGVTNQPGNLGPTCDHHNLIKLDGGWDLTQTQPGHFVWSTPAGLTYEVFPNPSTTPNPRNPNPRNQMTHRSRSFLHEILKDL
jgi:hypothetical protein